MGKLDVMAIFGTKKKPSKEEVPDEGDEDMSSDEAEMVALEDFMSAVKDGDKEAAHVALRDFVRMCVDSYDPDSEDEDPTEAE